MTGLILTAPDKTDLKLISELAKKLGIRAKTISDEELLDLGLLKAMEEGRKSKFVSKERIMLKLSKNGN
jgi:cobalamin biosynthesis protein CbiG